MDYFYKLENHGLYSALNLLLWVYAKNFKKRKHRHRKLLIDDSNSQYFKCKRFDYYFNFFKVKEDHTSATQINNFNLRHGNHLLGKNEINRVLEYTPLIKEKISKRMSSLNLPDKYSSIHVRRGDKVSGKFKESEIIGEEKYIKHLNIKCNNLNLFVMSDDFLVLSKINKILTKSSVTPNIYSFLNETDVGHDTDKNIKESFEYTEEYIVKLFTEIEIAKKSEYFIGSRKSNIFQYIESCCEEYTKCISVQ